jgi:DnaJ family protein C protein 28
MNRFFRKHDPEKRVPDKTPEGEAEEARQKRRRPITNISTVADEIIAEAMRDGAFDNLPGHGRPLQLDKNPNGEENELAHKLLKDNDFTLPWIADRTEMLDKIRLMRDEIRRNWEVHRIAYERARTDEQRAALVYSWRHTLNDLAEQVKGLNRRIANVNLTLPHSRFEIVKLNLDNELERIGGRRELPAGGDG